ncbi:MAG: ABC transporter ATP-binding protein/permease [Oscillospiraceae bacterium]|nr:ABC transporter ATP-binding protein/permease [Oscillospiraceae bacterium]
MKLILSYMRKYRISIFLGMVLKLLGTMSELMIPYILEHIIDEVVPLGQMEQVLVWGALMILTALVTRQLNVWANRTAVENAHNVSYDVRQDLFTKTANLSGSQFDAFGLPSLTSRMTSDSYNVQSFAQSFQTMCVRAPIMLAGGITVTMTMDPVLSGILCVMVPILAVIIISVSRYGIPLYNKVQERLDDVVRIMRENITGIRVVKALSKADYEKRHFGAANDAMAKSDIKASTVMAIPGPFMQTCLNTGLTLVVIVGATRVNNGQMKPGVILAFLTYFNMVMQGVMGINRIFMMISKASASANRIGLVLAADVDQKILTEKEAKQPSGDEFIRFEKVNFSYNAEGAAADASAFAGGDREQCLTDISFALKRGESLGIIGPTGCGKTTIINLLMRFYDVEDGGVFVDGRDVRTYDKDELHRKFGVVFQNDMVFYNTLRENIRFGRELDDEALRRAVEDAVAAEYVDSLEDGLDYQADIKGANLSGGQKQRLLIARALAADPEILILDDSSSALDYKTDAALRKAIFEHHSNSTTIMVAQRVSSIQNMTHILVMDNGRCIGYGSHQELLESCPEYREIYQTQMGAMA